MLLSLDACRSLQTLAHAHESELSPQLWLAGESKEATCKTVHELNMGTACSSCSSSDTPVSEVPIAVAVVEERKGERPKASALAGCRPLPRWRGAVVHSTHLLQRAGSNTQNPLLRMAL